MGKHRFKEGNVFGSKRKGRTFEKPIKTKLKEVIEGYISEGQFQEDLQKMNPVDRAKAVTQIIPYVLPKKREMTIEELSTETADEILDELLNNNEN